jgi:hypothetical protein
MLPRKPLSGRVEEFEQGVGGWAEAPERRREGEIVRIDVAGAAWVSEPHLPVSLEEQALNVGVAVGALEREDGSRIHRTAAIRLWWSGHAAARCERIATAYPKELQSRRVEWGRTGARRGVGCGDRLRASSERGHRVSFVFGEMPLFRFAWSA